MRFRRGKTVLVLLCACVWLMLPQTSPLHAAANGGLKAQDFKAIAVNGIDGDTANSYAWSLFQRDGDIYVGVNRHHLYTLLQAFAVQGLFDFSSLPIDLPGPPGNWGEAVWADAMLGKIFRYRNGSWELAHESVKIDSPELQIPLPGFDDPFIVPAGEYAHAYGYRVIGGFNGYIYAAGIGTWWPPRPFSSILRSQTGDLGTWENVTGIIQNALNPRGLVEYKGRLYASAQIGYDTLTGQCVVYSSADPGTEGWKQVSELGFGNSDNAEIYYLEVFNGCLYASTVNYNTGFEVWKTDGTELEDGKLVWKQVVKDGFGDTWNQYGMTMRAFGDYLYVGTAAGAGMVQKNAQPVGTRAIDIIRIDKNDIAELVMGAYQPNDPPPGWPTTRMPLSKIPAGFGNPFNVYTWHMEVHDGWLYAATFDMSGLLIKVVFELLLQDPETALALLLGLAQDMFELEDYVEAAAVSTAGDYDGAGYQQMLEGFEGQFTEETLMEFVDLVYQTFGGADLWKTRNGVQWYPVTFNGFGNPKNYGIRRIVSVNNEYLVAATANPMTNDPRGGCEVYIGKSDEPVLPGKAVLIEPEGDISETSPTFKWEIENAATHYCIWINNSKGAIFTKWLTADGVAKAADCSYVLPMALCAGEYRWWVRAWNEYGYGPWSDPKNFRVTGVKPAAATLISPDGATSENPPTFVWSQVEEATRYYLWVNNASGCVLKKWLGAEEVISDSVCAYASSLNLSPGVYKWWILTWNSYGYGKWSEPKTFSLVDYPADRVSLIAPNGEVSDGTPVFEWSSSLLATWYLVWINDASGVIYKKWVRASEVANGTACVYSPVLTLNSGSYRWWIMPWNSSGAGPWSAPMSFSVP